MTHSSNSVKPGTKQRRCTSIRYEHTRKRWLRT